jgi:hypothetical protein
MDATPAKEGSRLRRPWRRIGLDALLVLAVMTAVGLWQTRGHLASGIAPALSLRARDGQAVSL